MKLRIENSSSCDEESFLWPEGEKARYLENVNKILVSQYGLPTHGNKKDPLDEIIYIMLSSQTDKGKYQQTYQALERRYPSWNLIQPNDVDQIEEILKPAGLSKVKAKNLVQLLIKIETDFGNRSLASLLEISDYEAEKYLCSLPGVGLKSARCILMYSLNRKVFPVDTHNFRTLKRLGAHNFPLPIRKWHNKLQDMIPENIRFPLHVTLIPLGREICKAAKSLCERCPLNRLCCFSKISIRETS